MPEKMGYIPPEERDGETSKEPEEQKEKAERLKYKADTRKIPKGRLFERRPYKVEKDTDEKTDEEKETATYVYKKPENQQEVEQFERDLPNDVDSLLELRKKITQENYRLENEARADPSKVESTRDEYHKTLDKLDAIGRKLKETGYYDYPGY